jgi:uncharacterized protein (TIGR01777 family)
VPVFSDARLPNQTAIDFDNAEVTMSSLRVLIAGGTGTIGTAVATRLRAQGHEVHLLSRSASSDPLVHRWSPGVEPLDLDPLGRLDAIINLAGATVAKFPWTSTRKADIFCSRIDATTTLVEAIERAHHKPAALLNGSAVGFYGERGDETLTENSEPGVGFLASVCTQWEEAAVVATEHTRVVLLRTGLVLGREGALAPLRVLTKAFISGPLAGGKPWWPWISLNDEARAIIHLITSEVSGPVNLVGPEPARAGAMMRALAHSLTRPYWLPVPRFALSLLLGEGGREVLLASQKVIPEVLLTDGFVFDESTVDSALKIALDS